MNLQIVPRHEHIPVMITCLKCDKITKVGKKGDKHPDVYYDIEGKSEVAYYCNKCAKTLLKNQENK